MSSGQPYSNFDNIKESKWGFLRKYNNQAMWVTFAIMLMFSTLSIMSEPFSSGQNVSNIARNFAFIAIVALGQTLVIITAGIDLSVGSIMGLSGVTTAVVMGAGFNIYMGVGAGLGVALIFGYVNGYLITKFKVSPFVVTLGTLSIGRSLSMAVTEGRPLWEFGPDEELFFKLGGSEFMGIASPVWVMIILAIMVAFALKFTAWGKHVFALGSNESAAEMTGVNVKRVKISVYMVAALLAGIGGILLTSFLSAVTANLAFGYELRIIASSVIGGANLMGGEGGAYGAIIGALLIEMIRNGLLLLGVNPYWQGTFVGLFIILAVLLERIRGKQD